MIIRKAILLICLLLLPLTGVARTETQVYTIKKGDTLWGISERFLADPYYWPNLWSHNPFVRNPHLIYPGQKIAIVDGRIQFLPEEMKTTTPTTEALPTPEPAVTIKTLAADNGFVSSDDLNAVGTLIDTVDNRIMMGTGDKVFLKMGNLAETRPGDIFSIIQIGEQVSHPATGDVVGRRITVIGSLQVIETNPSVATAVITSASREVHRGDRIRPFIPPLQEVELKRASGAFTGYLVSALNGQMSLGQFDVVYIDMGSEDGLEVGNLLYISRPREATEEAILKEAVRLPDILLGSAVVTETHSRTATALILKAVSPVFRGDRVTTVTE